MNPSDHFFASCFVIVKCFNVFFVVVVKEVASGNIRKTGPIIARGYSSKQTICTP